MPALARPALTLTALVLAACAVYVFGARELMVVRVAGGSMYPALRAGDLCVVRLGGSFQARDIVLYEPPGHASRVLHRVRSINESGVVTQGDANPVPDFRPVPKRSVVGRVTAVVPVGGALESVATRLRR